MLDPKLITQMVEQEIHTAVNQQVQQAVAQTEWITDLENQIVQFVQDRITARFSNIGTVPDLIDTVERSVARMFEQGFVPDLASYVDDVKIKQTVDLAVERFAQATIDALVVDQRWLDKIQTQIEQRMVDRVAGSLRGIDLNVTLKNIVLENKGIVVDELRKEFFTSGIQDLSKDLQLSVMDGVVVVENELATRDLTVERNTHLKGDITIDGDLAVRGRINTDNKSWRILSDHIGEITYDRFKQNFAKDMTDGMIESIRQGIDFASVSVDGHPLLSGDTLSAGIKNSSLETVGTLKKLSVTGPASVHDTLHVVDKRIGINTPEPDSALTIWDEEISVSAGKFSKNTAWVGTNRKNNLVLGTGRQNQLEIDVDGEVTVQKLRVGRNSIGHATEAPNYSGSKGDIVFNINATPESPFAWICLGAFRWLSLKAAR